MTKILYNMEPGLTLPECLSDDFHDAYFKRTLKDFTEDCRADPIVFEIIDELGGLEEVDISYYPPTLDFRELPEGTRYCVFDLDGEEFIITEDEIEWRTA